MSLELRTHSQTRQSGSALIVSLVLLVVLTLIVVSIIKSTNVNSKVAGNMQAQKESESAAQEAIENVISKDFMAAPAAAASAAMAIDVNHDGTKDYDVNVPAPKCLNVTPIKVSQLDPANTEDTACYTSSTYTPGLVSGNSLCANTQWEIQATTTAANGGTAKVATHQGIAVRVAAGTPCP
jgi:Tfp pilus assembly protein PilX